jgi:hypothetical protein
VSDASATRKKLKKELKKLQAKSLSLSFARSSLPAGASRARVTSANAKWARVAEARDRVQKQLDEMPLKTSTPWIEEVMFVDCAECGESIELGTGVSISEGYEETCTECGADFWVETQSYRP